MMKCSNEYENKYQSLILGLDEAGRGPIAGPLVVAGVCLPLNYESDLIYDSKKLSEKKRLQAYEEIIDNALWYQVLIIDREDVDKLNIYQATKQAMISIASRFKLSSVILTDAMPFDLADYEVIDLVKGDQKSINIAAASILAKVTRDQLMINYDKKYPQYGFSKHKGYPTKAHLEALNKYGACPIHRRSYAPVMKVLKKEE